MSLHGGMLLYCAREDLSKLKDVLTCLVSVAVVIPTTGFEYIYKLYFQNNLFFFNYIQLLYDDYVIYKYYFDTSSL